MNLQSVNFSYPIIITFIAYAFLMLFIGFYFYKKNKNSKDYFIGNASMGPIITALSAGASDMSSWLLMAFPGALYAAGLGQIYIAIGLSMGAFLNWTFIAKRLKIFSQIAKECISIPDFFESRFNDDKHILRSICSVVILVFFTIYISAGLVSGAKLFESVFGLSYIFALSIGFVIIVLYTFLGGYKAVCWTDMIQGLLMMGSLIIIPLVMIFKLGGFGEAFLVINDVKPQAFGLDGGGWLVVVSTLAWGLGYFGQPHILIRFISIKHVKEIPTATFIGISWMVISLFGAAMIGFLGIAYIAKFDLSLSDPERIFIVMSQVLFNPWVAGILLSAILAAIMSTASSQLLVCASCLVQDFYTQILKRRASDKKTTFLSRLGVLIIACAAFLLSLDTQSQILSIVSYAWAGFGASFGSVILFSLFYKNMSKEGAIAGMIGGAISVILYKNFGYSYLEIYEIIPGFLIASLCIIVFSLLFKVQKQSVDNFEKMLKEL
ncbi:sodium/proline symporter PutP [Campylobacter peloridis]|uniref:sodium/proline symporter PutP n=1 Tax=Campylobacter peloridis TaxID=488546 RepID=UPI001C732C23|nr:sodium/proline symporter PutP [Campylobacter peloridis]MBX2078465.1 sodium/proline symporter PutP [Campylobacter peloridis]